MDRRTGPDRGDLILAEPLATILIPVYNEAENIGALLRQIKADVDFPCDIAILYDMEEDTTLAALPEIEAELGIRVGRIRNRYGRGVLNAMKTGLETVTTRYAIITMADLSDPPAVMNRMIEAAEKENTDVVCASRYMKGGRQIGGPFLKGLMSRSAGLSLYWLAGVPSRDSTNNFKLYRKSYLEQITIESTGGFELGIELTVKAHINGFKVTEVPTSWTDRVAGKSNFKLLKWLPRYLKWYLLALRHRLH